MRPDTSIVGLRGLSNTVPLAELTTSFCIALPFHYVLTELQCCKSAYFKHHDAA